MDTKKYVLMKKEEVVNLHKLLYVIATGPLAEELGYDPGKSDKYKELNIGPDQIQRDKEDHTQALYILAKELAGTAVGKMREREKDNRQQA